MKLWLIESTAWGWQIDVVRAETEADALRVAGNPDRHYRYVTVTELTAPDGEAVLWTYEDSPDTPRE